VSLTAAEPPVWLEKEAEMRIAEIASMYEAVLPSHYGGTEA